MQVPYHSTHAQYGPIRLVLIRFPFNIVPESKLFMFSATKDSSPCNSTLMNLLIARDRLPLGVWSERKAVLLDCSAGATEQEGDQSGLRLSRLGLIDEAYTVRSPSCSVDPSACS